MILGAHSYYSLRYGVLPPEQLVKSAAAAGHSVMALTDINNVTGITDFVSAARRYGIRPIAGMEIRSGDRLLYTAIVRNEQGFMQLNEWFSQFVLKNRSFPERPDALSDVFWIYPWDHFPSKPLENEWLGVRLDDRGRLLTAPRQWLMRAIIRHPFTFTTDLGFQFHRHLRAIDHNTLLSKVTTSMTANPNDRLFTLQEFKSAFEAWPLLDENTHRLLMQCSFDPDFETPKNKQTYTGSRADDHNLLRKLAYEGFEYRYGEGTPYARQRLEAELETIFRLGFAAYFLITNDIVKYSLSQGIYHVGRGSGANSLVAYCLRITDVDPIELNLYFERFINPKRTSPPDFDIDYSWRDRDCILEYIFGRFGHRHTALLGTTVTFQTNAAIRELAKVYGVPKNEVDQLLKAPNHQMNRDEVINTVLRLAAFLTDFPNQRSIHAGGVLISEQPIFAYTALDLPPKGFPTTQWDMYVAESIGFEKIDILSQRGIGHINECVQIVRQNRNLDIDVHRIEAFKRDQQTLDLLHSGETIGCFYIESPAMRGLLKKLRCRDYITLVAASSIVRPGLVQSGMMAEFIRRFHNPKGFQYLHPIIEEQLSETFGIMVYQEDVLKVCHHFAGLDLADADVLRRIMSGKHRRKGDLERISSRFFENCRRRGYPDEVVNELWRQISSFARYSFSKAHSASYAAESFQSLYLKAHFPLEFITAVINNFGGFYRTWVYVHEARRLGATVELPCVNRSFRQTSLHQQTIVLGFELIESLEHETIQKIVNDRQRGGHYRSLSDFLERVDVGITQLRILIRVGAFRFTGKTKPQLLWEAHMLHSKPDKQLLPRFFDTQPPKFTLPSFSESLIEHAYDEIELLGFPVSISYFDMLESDIKSSVTVRELTSYSGKRIQIAALLVDIKYVWTKHGELMHFANFIDRDGDFFDTIHFPESLRKSPFTGQGVYLLDGKVVVEFGHPSLEVIQMQRLSLKPDPRIETQRHAFSG